MALPTKLALEIGGKLLGLIGASDGAPNQQDRFDYSAQRALIRRKYSVVVPNEIG